MKKLLALTPKEFSTGIASDAYSQTSGLFTTANGLSVVRNPFIESEDVGILQACPAPVRLGAGTLAGTPISYALRVNSSVKYLYVLDDNGGIFTLDLSAGPPTFASVYSSGSGLQSGVAGAWYMKHSNGDEYLYFFHSLTSITRMGPLQTNNNLSGSYSASWQSTKHHTPHHFLDRYYIPNGSYVGVVYDDGSGGLTIDKTALDFESTYEAKCISDDGLYLVVGISTNTYTNNLIHADTKLLFWDTTSSSWAREWPVPDASILSIKNTPMGMVAITTRGVFSFSFNNAPKPLTPPLATADVPDFQYPAQQAADILGGAVAFGGGGHVSTFGKIRPNMQNAYMKPFSGVTDAVTLLCTSANTSYAIVGTSGNKLYSITYTGTQTTGVSGKTIFIDLKRYHQIGRIVVRFETPLASGDEFTLKVQGKSSDSQTTWGTAKYADSGAIQSKEMYGSLTSDHIRLIPSFDAGAVKIKEIEVWGDPIENPTYA